jgi:hypothetical protein
MIPIIPPFEEDSNFLGSWSFHLDINSGIANYIYGDGEFW